eukprot:30677-Pelagococcus_subviridis.AAC.7
MTVSGGGVYLGADCGAAPISPTSTYAATTGARGVECVCVEWRRGSENENPARASGLLFHI